MSVSNVIIILRIANILIENKIPLLCNFYLEKPKKSLKNLRRVLIFLKITNSEMGKFSFKNF